MTSTEIVEQVDTDIEVKVPGMFKVLLHNDDTTTFDFVIEVLITIFHRSIDDAISVTESIHVEGQGIAGSPYTQEVAEEKALETIRFARANGFPLVATFEEL